MQILRLLAARRFRRRRRAVSTITAATTTTAPCTPCCYGEDEDEGPFFDLDLTCCQSAPASTAGESGSESEDSSSCSTTTVHHAQSATTANAGDLDFVISLHRSRSASPSYEERLFFRGVAPPPPPPLPLKFCASEPSNASRRYSVSSSRSASRSSSRVPLRTLSFGGRVSFSRSTSISARSSARLFAAAAYGSPDAHGHDETKPSGSDVFRRYLSKISSRLRRVAVAPAADGSSRLRKSQSASAAQVAASSAAATQSPPPHQQQRRDDTLLEKQDGIASAIAHCKESFHRASVSECDTSLLRSRSDPGAGGAAVTTS